MIKMTYFAVILKSTPFLQIEWGNNEAKGFLLCSNNTTFKAQKKFKPISFTLKKSQALANEQT